MFAYAGCNTAKESFACDVLRHAANIGAHQLHGVPPVAVEQAMAIVGLGRGAVDDSNKVICDDDAVLAFLSGVLGYAVLLDYFHRVWEYKDTTR